MTLLPFSLIFSSFLLVLYTVYFSPYLYSQWLHRRHSLFSSSNFLIKKCHFLAVIITSEKDYTNGTINAWFQSLPANQSNHVCCVAVRRSPDTNFRLHSYSDSCDVLFVPMVRVDEYLTISEKVRLVFQRISDYYTFDWLLKTDADSFVCFSRILTLLRNFDPFGVIQLGYAESRNILLEDPKHYWYDPSMTDIVHNPRQTIITGTGLYHPYMQGAGYILSYGAMSRLRAMMPSLRYSPMEDAMVGSWLLSLNSHMVVLNLDLRGERGRCNLPLHLYISHNRKGRDVLLSCHEQHPNCAQIPNNNKPLEDITKAVSFIITSHMSRRYKQTMDLYHSIRAAFPTNPVYIADVSTSASQMVLARLLRTVNDPHLQGISLPRIGLGKARNVLVGQVSTRFVCVLKDEQRISWETMIGRMLDKVSENETDIASGFLKFNPNMNISRMGLFANGFRTRKVDGAIWKHWVDFDGRLPDESVPVDGTSGFILTRTSILEAFPWNDLGRFTDDEWHIRLQDVGIRMTLVNSGVRHGYHYELDPSSVSNDSLSWYAQRTCELLRARRVVKIYGLNNKLDCEKHLFVSTNSGTEIHLRW